MNFALETTAVSTTWDSPVETVLGGFLVVFRVHSRESRFAGKFAVPSTIEPVDCAQTRTRYACPTNTFSRDETIKRHRNEKNVLDDDVTIECNILYLGTSRVA